MLSVWQDVRYGVRMLRKNPGFAAVVILSCTLGIGANITIFSLVNSLLLRPLPGVTEPDQLVAVYGSRQGRGYFEMSYPDIIDYREQNKVFTGIAASAVHAMAVSPNNQEARQVTGALVTANYFDVLGVKPIAGRFFLPEEDRTPDTHPVAVISYNLWKGYFNSNPSLVGTAIKINGHSFNVIGIAPESFQGTITGLATDVWAPVMMHKSLLPGADIQNREAAWLLGTGRLKAGMSMGQARADLETIASNLAQSYPVTNKERGVSVASVSGVHPEIRGTIAAFLTILMVVVGLVLLIAATNVASLLLARSVGRRREISIRIALGASRWRIVRQLLTESVLLALLGGAFAVLITHWLTDLLLAFKPTEIPFSLDLSQDIRVFIFAFVLSFVVGTVFALVPALQATKVDVASDLKEENLFQGYRRSRLRSFAIVVQVALSLVLLITAGLFVRSLSTATTLSPGFDTANMYVMPLNPTLVISDEVKLETFYRDLLARVGAIPGVRSVTLSRFIPMGGAADRVGVMAAGQEPPSEGRQPPGIFYNLIAPNYFNALDFPVVRGRAFTDQDRAGSPNVIIVNEAMARQFWPDEEPIAKRVRIRDQEFEVVGVAKNIKYRSLVEEPRPYFYVPALQSKVAQFPAEEMLLQVRTENQNSQSVTQQVRKEVQSLEPNLPLFGMTTMDERMRSSLLPTQLAGTILGISGALALLLSVFGIYGLVSYSVAQRTREIGVRIAIGAQKKDIFKLIIVQTMKLIVIGLIFGLIGAFILTRATASLLYGVSPTDATTFILITLLLMLVALIACSFPARKAIKVDPIDALRYQ
jgi:predicted permease